MWGKTKVRLHPAPSGTDTIYIEGHTIPDMALFASDSDFPDMPSEDHSLLSVGASITILERGGVSPEQLKGLKARWDIGIAKRKAA